MEELDDDKTSHLEGADASVDQWREGSDALVVRVTGEVDMSNAATVQEVVDQVTGSRRQTPDLRSRRASSSSTAQGWRCYCPPLKKFRRCSYATLHLSFVGSWRSPGSPRRYRRNHEGCRPWTPLPPGLRGIAEYLPAF